MRLETLRLRNFRGYVDREFTLHPQFNLVIGENGAGKTSFLEAAAVAIGSWLLGFPGQDSRSIRPRDVRTVLEFVERRYRELPQYPVVVEATGHLHVARAVRNDDTGQIEYLPVTRHPEKANPREQLVTWKRTLESQSGKTSYRGASRLKKFAGAMSSFVLNQDPRVLPLIRYFGAGRLWESVRDTERKALSKHRGKQPSELAEDADEFDRLAHEAELEAKKLAEPFYGYRMSVDKRCNPDDLIRWMGVERRNELDEEDSSPALRLVYQAIEAMLPEIASARYSTKLRTLVLRYANGERHTFSELSDGYRNVVAIAADLAIKAAMLNPQLAERALELTPGVVLIDELDLHLHPKWQRRIIADLRRTFPLVQFICTTHSPFLIQSLEASDELISLGEDTHNNGGLASLEEGSTEASSQASEELITDDLEHLGIEAIASGIMGVPADASPRYLAMLHAARAYIAELDEAAQAPAERLEQYKRHLAERLAPYADNPAFQAVLEAERIDKLGR